jgi:general secretion pathway protein E
MNAVTDRRLSFAFAKKHGVLVASTDGVALKLMLRAGVDRRAVAEARRHLGQPVVLETVDEARFESLLQAGYASGENAAAEAAEGLEEDTDLAHLADELPEPSDLMESEDDAPIIKLINAVLTQAVRENASDIHIEPFENRLVIRFRVHGQLREVLQSKRALAMVVVSRIKVMSKLDIAEKRLPQDGRISLRIAGRPVDVRVSTLPSGHGERVVMRLLDKQAGRLDLGHLGMAPNTQSQIDELIHKPYGIILVTGPTGSGKTTTLYAALERLNDTTRNIMTVEDPIEYYIDGIGQTQVNTKVDMTFARGLRAILRQDPDVVMIGEIRDIETAQIAVQASLTGHLVLSTLHTNTAVGAITRLRDMGVEPFLLSSTLLGVVAQRLVRVLEPTTRVAYEASARELELLGTDPQTPTTLYKAGAGAHGGYRGRTGIYELTMVDDGMRQLIHDGAGEHELERHARALTGGIRDDGRRRILAGQTTLEEVLRVTRED